ncbi:MAG: DUF11 domain-containing protein [Acidobacteria bacterium]|nr:DUF11 domain-containing protein [Acidobacteriota bacterium]
MTNNGPSSVTGAILNDPLVANLTKTLVACSGTPGQCVVPPSVVQLESGSFALPTLASGQTYQITVTATVANGATGSVANAASVAPPVGTVNPGTSCTTSPAPNARSFVGGVCTSTDTDTVNLLADLAVTKDDGVTSVNAGGSTTYTVTLTNSGPSAANGSTISDPAATGLTKTAIGVCTAAGGAVCPTAGGGAGQLSIANLQAGTVVVPTLPSGGSISFTITATVTATTGSVTNTFSATPPVGTTDSNGATASDTDTVTPVTDLAITKTDGSATYTAGNAITYTIVVSNSGPSNAIGASVADSIPAAITGTTINCVASGVATCGTNASAGNNLSFTGVNINSGAGNFITITVSGTINPSTTGNLVNTATVSVGAGQLDPTPGNNSATDTDTPAPLANLVVTKDDGVTSVNAGGSTTYTVTLTNSGPSAANGSTISDPAATGLTKTAIGVCTAASGAVCPTAGGAAGQLSITNLEAGTVVVPTLPVGGSISFTITATVTATSGSVTNTFSAAPPAGTVDPSPASASDTDTVNPIADLAVTKDDGVTSVNAGGTTTYTVTLTNSGPSAANGSTIGDTAGAGLTITSIGICTASGGAVCPTAGAGAGQLNITNLQTGTVVVPTLPSGGSISFTITATVTATTGSVTNTFSVTGLGGGGATDPTPGNNSASDTDTVTPVTDLAITKTDGAATYTAGNPITYTIVVSNSGPSNAIGASVADAIPAAITGTTINCVASGTAICGTNASAGNNLSFTGVNINSGAGNFITITISGIINPSTTGNLVNTATVTVGAGQVDLTTGNNSATDTDTPNPIADLAVQKNGPATVAANGTVVYTIRVSNAGPSAANGAAVTDPFPGVLSGVTWVCNAATGGATCGAPAGVGNLNTTVALFPPGGSDLHGDRHGSGCGYIRQHGDCGAATGRDRS